MKRSLILIVVLVVVAAAGLFAYRWWMARAASPGQAASGAALAAEMLTAWRAELSRNALPTCTERGRFSIHPDRVAAIVLAGAPCTEANLMIGPDADTESPKLEAVRGVEMAGNVLLFLDVNIDPANGPVWRTHIVRRWANGTEGVVGILQDLPAAVEVAGGELQISFTRTMQLPGDEETSPSVQIATTFRGPVAALTLRERKVTFSDAAEAAPDLGGHDPAEVGHSVSEIARIALLPVEPLKKEQQLSELRQELGEELFATALRLVPIYNAGTNRYQPYLAFAAAAPPTVGSTATPSSVQSPLEYDPVGVALREAFAPKS